MTRTTWAYRMESGAALKRAPAQAPLEQALAAGFVTEATLKRRTGQDPGALLLQLDQAGRLARELRTGRRAWAQLLPQRHPGPAPAAAPPKGKLRLVDSAVLHADGQGVVLEAAGGWARLRLLQPDLMALLHALAGGCTLARLRSLVPQAGEALTDLLWLMRWSGLLQDSPAHGWALQDLLLHSRTRRGFGAAAVGKQTAPVTGVCAVPGGVRTAMVKGEASDLQLALGQALRDRQSLRQHGAKALSSAVLGRLLWQVFAPQVAKDGRLHRAYPSGGGCYALRPYLVVLDCAGLAAGAYAYDEQTHELARVDNGHAAVTAVMRDAAASAGQRVLSQNLPQVLLVLCADYARLRSAYGDLAYSLLLKEVGAVMQTVQLVATALGLASCPLGTGDSHQFARLAGANVWQLPSVGEVMLGSPANPHGGVWD